MKTTTLVAFVALLALCVAGRPVCHNITGTCTERGFECVSGEVVTHQQRCDGVEDCSDGTDELLCEHADHRPLAERTAAEREGFQQASCVNCNCYATRYAVVKGSSAWWPYAIVSPTDVTLMTTGASGAGGRGAGLPCHTDCTTTISMTFFRKNRICRGWLCCARQFECTACITTPSPCTTNSVTASHCWAV